MITICILILLYSVLGKPVGALIEKIKEVDWQHHIEDAKDWIGRYAKKAGRAATRPLLQWWFVMADENTTAWEKALIFGAIAYIIIPGDLVPRRVFRFLGLVDDMAVVAWLFNKIDSKLTQEIKDAVEDILDDWFGSPDVICVR